jgi:hypothetical protein
VDEEGDADRQQPSTESGPVGQLHLTDLTATKIATTNLFTLYPQCRYLRGGLGGLLGRGEGGGRGEEGGEDSELHVERWFDKVVPLGIVRASSARRGGAATA